MAVFIDEKLMAEASQGGRKNHAAILLPTIDACLKTAVLKISEIDEVYVCSGPGSFTGVRVAIATALGLTEHGARLRVFPYSALLLAERLKAEPALWDEKGVIGLCADAGRGEKYCTLVELGAGAGVPSAAPRKTFSCDVAGSQLVSGEDFEAFAAENRCTVGGSVHVKEFFGLPADVREKFLTDSPEALYFRESQAEEQRRRNGC